MIQNDRQYRITKEKLKELKAFLARLKKKYKADEFDLYSAGVREWIQQLQAELKEYKRFEKKLLKGITTKPVGEGE